MQRSDTGVARSALAALVAALAVLAAMRATGVGAEADRLVHDGILAGASAVCLLRTLRRPRERAAWGSLTAGLTLFTLGDAYYLFVLSDLEVLPLPSLADAGWLGFYPGAFVALALLTRGRLAAVTLPLVLDALIAACGLAALVAAFVFPPVLATAEGGPADVALLLGYPVADSVLAVLTVSVLAVGGLRIDRRLALVAVGFLLFAAGNVLYAVEVARGTYDPYGIEDLSWPAAAVLLAAAAWLPSTSPRWREGLRTLLLPAGFALLALGLLVAGGVRPLPPAAVALATAALLAVLARLAATFRRYLAALSDSRAEAATDALTGLANRRELLADLAAPSGGPSALVLFDLDGFKDYNDRFGHGAGDALLVRLAGRLSAAVAGAGRAYRLGGDEFCVLLRRDHGLAERIGEAAAALSDRGEGFAIGASHGVALLPDEATTPEDALRQADQRMYAHKHGVRGSTARQLRDVLVAALRERAQQTDDTVADLCRRTCEALGLPAEVGDEVVRAVELRDLGKLAIPEGILRKPGSLDAGEWALLRRHPEVAQRILGAAPALRGTARQLRSASERWDGAGYPDGLRGAAIPIGARIVAVCAAFAAMTAERPYAPLRTPAEALAELRRGAGTQFDPEVVGAFAAAFAAAADALQPVTHPR